MDFTTHIDIPRSEAQLTHQHKVLMLGSCFADNIGQLLTRDKFDVVVNPFGTLYNPASIAAHLWRCISEKEYLASSPEVVASSTPFSWMHHSSLSAPSMDALLTNLNETLHATAQRLREADWLVITFGSSYIYRLKESGMLVANCHKQPDALFVRQRLAACDIVDQWTQLLQMLLCVNPGLRIIFTVSPIRHQRDGLHQNQLSKAELLLAVESIVNSQSSKGQSSYFPSYELMMDELRDYRFYAADMIHPSSVAVDYIYERFTDTYIYNKEEQQLTKQCRDIHAALAHRQLGTNPAAYRQFLDKTLQKIDSIQQQYPSIDWTSERQQLLCNIQSKK